LSHLSLGWLTLPNSIRGKHSAEMRRSEEQRPPHRDKSQWLTHPDVLAFNW